MPVHWKAFVLNTSSIHSLPDLMFLNETHFLYIGVNQFNIDKNDSNKCCIGTVIYSNFDCYLPLDFSKGSESTYSDFHFELGLWLFIDIMTIKTILMKEWV